MNQLNIFDLTMPEIQINNTIRLIELFAGYGSQAMSMDVVGAEYEHWKVVEFDEHAIKSYNAAHGTSFMTQDIRDIHSKDLEISETNKYTYMLTYSFPCTDLSPAGKGKGMKKGSGTRSGLLWEVERILREAAGAELPQILYMENVPQVISQENKADFHKWQQVLTDLGYTNHFKILNANGYGVAQNRARAYMFSFLGEFNYHFPEEIELKRTIEDYLEDEVDRKYYINTEKARQLISNLVKSKKLENTQRACTDLSIKATDKIEVANCITGRENRSVSNIGGIGNGVVEKKIKQIGNMVNSKKRKNPSRGRIYDITGIAPTINCMGGGEDSQ